MIQQSINQMLGSLGAITSIGRHFKEDSLKQQKADLKAEKDAQSEATRTKQFNALKRQNNKYMKQVSSLEKRMQEIEGMQPKDNMQLMTEMQPEITTSENVEMNKRALESLKNKASASLEQDKKFKALRDLIYYENIDRPEKGVLSGGYYIPYNPKGSIMTEEEYDKMDKRAFSKLIEMDNIKKYGKNYKKHPEYLKEQADWINSIFNDDEGGK